MAFSVRTNAGAMSALKALNEGNASLETVQNRINTGLAVGSTKDNSAKYTVAQTLRGDVAGLTAVTSSLNNAKSTVDVAVAGVEEISDLVNELKAKAYEGAGVRNGDFRALRPLQQDYNNLVKQLKAVIASSDFNGVNLLKTGGGSVSSLQTLDTTTAGKLSVPNLNLQGNATISTMNASQNLGDSGKAMATVGRLDTLSGVLNDHLSTLGAASRRIESQLTFTNGLSDVVRTGIGHLVDADLAKESAKLEALQVRQQLGVQALSIANQSPQTILSLFN